MGLAAAFGDTATATALGACTELFARSVVLALVRTLGHSIGLFLFLVEILTSSTRSFFMIEGD